MNFYEQHKKILQFVILFITVFIIVPLIIRFLIHWDTTNKSTDDDWLGFWGSYVGSIIGVIGAFGVFQFQLIKDRERAKEERTDNTFFNLLNMFIDQQNYLVSEHDSKKDIFEDMLNKIKDNSDFAYKKQGIRSFYEKKSELLFELDKALKASEKYVNEKMLILTEEERKFLEPMRKNDWGFIKPDDNSNMDFEDTFTELRRINRIRELQKAIEDEAFIEIIPKGSEVSGVGKILTYLYQVIHNNELLDAKCKKFITEKYDIIYEYTKQNPRKELESARKKNAVEIAQEPYRKQVGSYFRIFHRIIKYLNENVDDKQIKKNYIGFLRANMNENQMAMIFYNIYYTERGSGALEELKGTGFFGEKSELNGMESAHFFSPETLVWGNDDLKRMQEFC